MGQSSSAPVQTLEFSLKKTEIWKHLSLSLSLPLCALLQVSAAATHVYNICLLFVSFFLARLAIGCLL